MSTTKADVPKANCKECGKAYNRKYLLNHMSSEHKIGSKGHETKKLVCTICKSEYTTNEDLLLHIRRNHRKEDEEKKKCNYCEKIFGTISATELHMKQKNNHT